MKAGDKVVCVADDNQDVGPNIKIGEIYTYKCIHDFDKDYCEIYEISVFAFLISSFVPLQDWQQAETMTEELIQETLMPVEI